MRVSMRVRHGLMMVMVMRIMLLKRESHGDCHRHAHMHSAHLHEGGVANGMEDDTTHR
jgi:hypothetical protein